MCYTGFSFEGSIMNTFIKRTLSIVVVCTMALVGLVACGPSEPTSAQEVIERYSAHENYRNYHTNVAMDYEIEVLGQNMPITIKLDADVADDDAHATVVMEALGQKQNLEMYITKEEDAIVQYQSSSDEKDATWTKTTLDAGSFTDQIISQDILNEAEFEKVEDGYTLTVPGEKLMDVLASSGVDLSGLLSELGDAGFGDAIKDSKVVYTFDKDCLLTGCTYNVDFDYSYGDDVSASNDSDGSSSAIQLTMSMKMNMDVVISDYGKTDPVAVEVPKDVRENAVDMGELTESFEELTELTESNAADTTA